MLVVFHKAQVQRAPHIAGLRQPPRVAAQSSKTVLASDEGAEVPYFRASNHQRNFVGHVSKMWSILTAAVLHTQEMNIHSVKLADNN